MYTPIYDHKDCFIKRTNAP